MSLLAPKAYGRDSNADHEDERRMRLRNRLRRRLIRMRLNLDDRAEIAYKSFT